MTISRRSFFVKVAGSLVATRVVPSAFPIGGVNSGARVGAIAGSIAGGFTVTQVGRLSRISDELLEDSAVDLSAVLKEWGDA